MNMILGLYHKNLPNDPVYRCDHCGVRMEKGFYLVREGKAKGKYLNSIHYQAARRHFEQLQKESGIKDEDIK